MTTITKMTIRVDQDWHIALKQAALDRRTTVTQIVIDAVDKYLEEDDKMARDYTIKVYATYTDDMVLVDTITATLDAADPVAQAKAVVSDKGHDVMDAEGCCEVDPLDDKAVIVTVYPTFEVTNPWTGVQQTVSISSITDERLEALTLLMDDENREDLHNEMVAYCTPGEFWKAYADRVGPEEAGRLWFS